MLFRSGNASSIPHKKEPITEVVEAKQPWHAEVGELLAKAAQLCVENDIDVDAFMKGAWIAYVEARPGMSDFLEEMQLRNQLDELRRLGRVGEA